MFKNRIQVTVMISTLLTLVVLITAFCAFSAQTHAAAAAGPQAKTSTQSNISQAAKAAIYSPKTLSCTRVTGHSCITIKNTTGTKQSVTAQGKVLYNLNPGQVQAVSYSAAGTYTYGLSSNSKATLTITVS